VLLRALPPLVRRFPRLRCLVVGDGPLDGALRREAEALGLAGHCRFTGARPDVADLLAAVDVVVLPSLSEGLPFVLLEAMAVGKPVVATRVGGNPEVVEDGTTGLLVPPGDADALGAALARLLDDSAAAAAMGGRGQARVRERFTVRAMIEALEALYASLAEGRA
jgi:glycosyltransferase involved in cell wall biosynthesis